MGYVDAGNQQYRYHGGHEHPQCGPNITNQLLAKGHQVHAEARVRIRILLRQPLRDDAHFTLRPLARHSRLQARQHMQLVHTPVAREGIFRLGRVRGPKLGLAGGKPKGGGSNTDDGERAPVQQHGFAKNIGIPAKAALPKAATQDGHMVFVGLILIGRE